MEEFKREVRGMSTEDLRLILRDQQELYTDEELQILQAELKSRNSSFLHREATNPVRSKVIPKEADEDVQEYLDELSRPKRERQARSERFEAYLKEHAAENADKLARLKASGHTGYYQYRVVSISDNANGGIDPMEISEELNAMALDGWYIKCAYTNEMGHNSISSFGVGVNATMDENILIMERFVKFQ